MGHEASAETGLTAIIIEAEEMNISDWTDESSQLGGLQMNKEELNSWLIKNDKINQATEFCKSFIEGCLTQTVSVQKS